MPSRIRTILVFLILLVPSAQFAWRNRQMPQFGYLHDDGLLFVTAKSIAAGSYRIQSLPENLLQTKFPPLYPLYLSVVWRINPHFPDNLKVATLFSWLVLAIYLALAWAYYRRAGLTERRTWLLVALLGVNPYLTLFGSIMFSDVFFTCWLLATLLVASRDGTRMAMIAGVLAGCAYLSRTAGIALLVSVPAWMAWKREWRRSAAFLAAMLPAVIGWTLWTRMHVGQAGDSTLAYYTDYIGYLPHLRFADLAVVLWKNLDQVLYSMGSMVLPKVIDFLPMKILAQVIAVAMITGTMRLVWRGVAVGYALFALVSIGILLVWNFPSTERSFVPLYPLLLAGLATEIEHVVGMLRAAFRHKDFGQRAVAGMLSAGVVAVFGAAIVLQLYMTLAYLQGMAEEKAAKLRDLRTAYTWISENLPASATLLSYDDPLLYLYTGRRGNYLPLNPRWWYTEDHASIRGAYRNLPAYCRSRGLEYVYFTSEDAGRETGDEDRHEIQRVVRENPELLPIFQAGIGTLYKLGPPRP